MKLVLYADSVTRLPADVLAVSVFEGALAESWAFAALDKALDGLLSRAAAEEEFEGSSESTLHVHANGSVEASRILVVGLGSRASFGPTDARMVTVNAANTARRIGARSVGVALPDVDDHDRLRTFEALAEGLYLGAYRYDRHKAEGRPFEVSDVRVALPPNDRAAARGTKERAALNRGALVADCVNKARDLVNGPPNEVTPTHLSEFARRIAKQHDLKLKLLDRKDCRKLGMGLYLAVAQGSREEPKFIHLVYEPPGRKKPDRTIGLVGKGITFDSGGLSIKSAKGMEDMKTDMAGGAAVLGAMEAIAQLEPNVRVHAVCAATENMPGGGAYRPGDIITGMSGRTVEVLNTDAEGRLTLADAIHYIETQGVDEIIELSTLTGACVVALGNYTVGLMSTDDNLAGRIEAAAKDAGEGFWRLPLVDRIADHIKSEFADCKNIGGPYGGAISAGHFLNDFVDKTPFAHCDIAGPSSADKPWGVHPKGGTAVGLMTLVEYVTRTTA